MVRMKNSSSKAADNVVDAVKAHKTSIRAVLSTIVAASACVLLSQSFRFNQEYTTTAAAGLDGAAAAAAASSSAGRKGSSKSSGGGARTAAAKDRTGDAAAHYTPTGVRFEPGSLPLNRSETISQCYAGPGSGIRKIGCGCAWSDKYKLLFWYVGKTGSSTQRVVMKDSFEAEYKGQNKPCKKFADKLETKSALKVVVTRHPIDLFISAVKEMFFRSRVFEEQTKNNIPVEYGRFLKLLDGMDLKEKKKVEEAETPEHLKIKNAIFETFVADYDGENPFDGHLPLQMTKMFRPDTDHADLQQFDMVLESKNLTEGLATLARRVGASVPPPIKKRDSSIVKARSLNEDAFKDETYQQMCRVLAPDLCCLNYEMPEPCRRAPAGKRVMCEWVVTKDGNNRAIKSVLV